MYHLTYKHDDRHMNIMTNIKFNNRSTNILKDVWTHKHIPTPYICPISQILRLYLTHVFKKFCLFKAKFPTPKET